MLKEIIIGSCVLIAECGAIQESFIDAVHEAPLESLKEFVGTVHESPLKSLKEILLSLEGHEHDLGENFVNLYLENNPQDYRSNMFFKLGDEGRIVYQAAEFVARSCFADMKRNIFDTKKAEVAIKWLNLVHNDEVRFNRAGTSQDKEGINDLLLTAKQILEERKKFESEIDSSEEHLLDLLRLAKKGIY